LPGGVRGGVEHAAARFQLAGIPIEFQPSKNRQGEFSAPTNLVRVEERHVSFVTSIRLNSTKGERYFNFDFNSAETGHFEGNAKVKSNAMPNLQLNDAAPDVRLLDLNRQPIPLAEMWRGGRNVLLVFLRHLG
jgi:hypothetical protein